MKQPYIEAGRITNTHGVRGELKLEVWLDRPEDLKHYPRIFIGGVERKLLSVRPHLRFVIAQLEGVENLNVAMTLKGRTFSIAREDAQLPPGGYFLQDLLGASVVSEADGSAIGTLTDILERPASDVYVVLDVDGREHLIPAVPAFIRNVDADAGVVTVRLIEGL